ncbi:hypothetical protein FBU59_000114 [Linderina macrospora]|uniref:Uncharacterized protein n=1 Tax=Linderina macrospora TaxID=4868 RepID=A0ACC1JHX7_9FUNG|nr:hypothetical protein FBU59_000114 [Linderina macrospora]
MLSGITQVWLCPADLISPPKELAGIDLPQPAEERDEEPQPREWMQGHMFVPAGSDAEHYSILAVPAHQPPHIHGCMISGTTTPAFYDVYISQYAEDTITVKYCVFNVERNGGAGDALALELDMPATGW